MQTPSLLAVGRDNNIPVDYTRELGDHLKTARVSVSTWDFACSTSPIAIRDRDKDQALISVGHFVPIDFDPLMHGLPRLIREARKYGEPASVLELLALKAGGEILNLLTSETNPLSRLPALGTPLEDCAIVPGISRIPQTKYWRLTPIRAHEWLSAPHSMLISVVLERNDFKTSAESEY